MKKVVWGVLSTAQIGTQKVIPAMLASDHIEVRAIASRTPETAREAAAALGIALAYGSYAELLADPLIEAIYNPLPNHLHVPLTLQAARAGKHVLCEKPIALNAAEAAALREVADRVLVMEAFMVRFHPQWLRARELIRDGQIGMPRAVQMMFSFFNEDPANIRNDARMGGGALCDIGCYAVTAGRFFFETDPVRGVALLDRDPRFGTDRLASALLDFGAGRHLDFTVSTQCVSYQRLQILGSKGRIEIQVPVNAPAGTEVRLFIDDGSAFNGAAARTETFAAVDQYRLQAEVFSRAIRGEVELPYGIEHAINGMRALDALFRSEKSGRWEDV